MLKTSPIARQWLFNLPVSAMAVNRRGDWVALTLGDGSARLLHAEDAETAAEAVPQERRLHEGVSLCLTADADDHAFLSGGDDGRVVIFEPDVAEPAIVAERKGKWVDNVAASSSGKGLRAYSIGREAIMLDENGDAMGKPLLHSSSVGGLAFSPNGKRLAASRYGGVSLWWANSSEQEPESMEWKGSHLSVLWHPDGKILLTELQENALHGWRLADGAEMRMQGYASKIRSMGFTAKGRYLATGGAGQIICWPFFGGGPWNKQPLTLGGNDARVVARVAPHPRDELVAAGYDDGMVVIAPLDGRMEIMLAPPSADAKAAIVGLAWNAAGDCLFAASENGTLSLFTLSSVSKMARGG